ncbi:MAG: ATP-binding cassette domain-containing protein [Anaerolineae bacterium]
MKDFSWKYADTNSFALENTNLDIEEGTSLAIVGPNESGKTTLVSAIKGLVPHSYNGVMRGHVEVFGKNVARSSSLDLAQKVGMVFSDPEAQFTAMTVLEELVFGMENLGLSVHEIDERLKWAINITDIGSLLDKSPFDISGGQKQRVNIASVLAMRPPILILDEPASMLDPLGKDFIFDVLTTLREEVTMTLIVVEHNIAKIAPLVDRMALVYGGQVVKVAEPREFFEDVDYLEEHHVEPPEVTALVHWLRDKGHYDGALPLTLEQGVSICREVLSKGATHA